MYIRPGDGRGQRRNAAAECGLLMIEIGRERGAQVHALVVDSQNRYRHRLRQRNLNMQITLERRGGWRLLVDGNRSRSYLNHAENPEVTQKPNLAFSVPFCFDVSICALMSAAQGDLARRRPASRNPHRARRDSAASLRAVAAAPR